MDNQDYKGNNDNQDYQENQNSRVNQDVEDNADKQDKHDKMMNTMKISMITTTQWIRMNNEWSDQQFCLIENF